MNKSSNSYLSSLIVNSFRNQVTDKGSKADRNISFWLPDYSDDYYYLGMYASNNYDSPPNPPGHQNVYKPVGDKSENPCLKAPLGFTTVWTCIEGGQSSNLGIYSLNAPNGYIGIGSVAVWDFNIPPQLENYPQLMCVRQDLCHEVTIGLDYRVWTDKGSHAPKNVSIWLLPHSLTCVATIGNNYPISVKVWDIKQLPTHY